MPAPSLLNLLNQIGLQNKDPDHYQFLKELLKQAGIIAPSTTTSGGGGGGTVGPAGPKGDKGDKGDIGPPGRAGVDGGNRTLMLNQGGGGSPSPFVNWSVLTNGNVTNPELIFAGGDVIMTHVP